MKKNKKSKKKYLIIGMLFLFSLYLVFNEDGLLQYFQLKGEVENLNSEINQTEKKIEKLEKEIDSLRNDPIKIENIARKKYHMKSKNEKLIKIREQ